MCTLQGFYGLLIYCVLWPVCLHRLSTAHLGFVQVFCYFFLFKYGFILTLAILRALFVTFSVLLCLQCCTLTHWDCLQSKVADHALVFFPPIIALLYTSFCTTLFLRFYRCLTIPESQSSLRSSYSHSIHVELDWDLVLSSGTLCCLDTIS